MAKAKTEQTTEQPEETGSELTELEALRDDDLPGDDYDPAKDEAEAERAQKDKEEAIKAAQASAMVTVNVLEAGLGLVAPGVQVAPQQKQQVAEKLAPVLAKYNAGGMPPWLAAYKEELDLLTALGMVGLSIYAQVKMNRAKDVTGAGNGEQSEPEAA